MLCGSAPPLGAWCLLLLCLLATLTGDACPTCSLSLPRLQQLARQVKVDRSNWGSVFLGVAPRHASTWNGYGFLNYRACQAYGSEIIYGAYYAAGEWWRVYWGAERGFRGWKE